MRHPIIAVSSAMLCLCNASAQTESADSIKVPELEEVPNYFQLSV
ncbi:unknown [Prevotella sp. CAG:485]|nr:unknown [Prevotella sp. CAG:485]